MARDFPRQYHKEVKPSKRMAYLIRNAQCGRFDPSMYLPFRRQRWDTFRELNLKPANTQKCYVCKKQAAEWHHIVFVCRGGADRLSNLVPLCITCHKTVHRGNTGAHRRPKKKPFISPFRKPTQLVVYVPPQMVKTSLIESATYSSSCPETVVGRDILNVVNNGGDLQPAPPIQGMSLS